MLQLPTRIGSLRIGDRPSVHAGGVWRYRMALLAGLILAALAGPAWAEQEVTSKIEAVTLYRGQALVTRVVNLPDATGELELVVPDLPGQVLPESLFASGDGVKIRSVRYRAVAVAAAPRKDVADLDAKIAALRDQQYANEQTKALLDAKEKYLDKMENFTAPTMQVEMAKGVLDAKQISDLSEYILKQRASLLADRIAQHKAVQTLTDALTLLERQRQELAGDTSKTVHQALLFISKAAAEPKQMRLSYLVANANWTPAYDFRLDADGQTVGLDYLGHVTQTSGEDWKDVKLTLSTAERSVNAEIPLLAPLWVTLHPPGGPGGPVGGPAPTTQPAAEFMANNSRSQYTVLNAWQTKQGDQLAAGWDLNRLSAETQHLELWASSDTIRAASKLARPAEEGLAVTYEIAGAQSLASRADTQLVSILSTKIAGKGFFEAIPLLTTYVYRGVDLSNSTGQAFLPGPYTAYVGGEFVGRGTLPLTATGQNLTIGFGVDTQLRCAREFKDKTDETKLGSRIQTYRYSVQLVSFKDKPVTVRLLDRIPTGRGEEIDVKLGKTGQTLSEDADYTGRDEKSKGLLRWDVALPASAFGAKAVKIEYSFTMTFADTHGGTTPAELLDDMRREFEERYRSKR